MLCIRSYMTTVPLISAHVGSNTENYIMTLNMTIVTTFIRIANLTFDVNVTTRDQMSTASIEIMHRT